MTHYLRRALLAVILLVAVLAAGACGAADSNKADRLQSAGVLRVGTEGTYAPFSYHDDSGELVGYDVDVARAVADKLGVKAEFVETHGIRCLRPSGRVRHRRQPGHHQRRAQKLYDLSDPTPSAQASSSRVPMTTHQVSGRPQGQVAGATARATGRKLPATTVPASRPSKVSPRPSSC